MARGSNPKNKFLKVEITTPTRLFVQFDRDAVLKVVGQKLADDARKAMRAGRSRTGEALPDPEPKAKDEPAGRPLNDTGRLIRDLRYDKKLKQVMPSTFPRADVSNRARNSFGLLKIHIRNAELSENPIDPLGTQDPALAETAAKYAQKALDNLATTGKLTLKGTGKKRKRIV